MGSKTPSFTNHQDKQVSEFLQKYMQDGYFDELTADERADLLALRGIILNDVGPKPGFNFREMLRQGRDGQIPLVTSASS